MRLAVFDADGRPYRLLKGGERGLVTNLFCLPADCQTRVLNGSPFDHVEMLVLAKLTDAGPVAELQIPQLSEFDAAIAAAGLVWNETAKAWAQPES